MGKQIQNARDEKREVLIRRAFWIEFVSVIWMILEAVVAVVAGIQAHSLALMAFGVDSGIELISAGLLLWRLWVELEKGRIFSEVAEKRASRIGGILLLTLAVYVIVSASWSLWQRQGAEFSMLGLILSVLAVPIMFWLSKIKLRISDQIKSRALRTDAFESITCCYLSLVVVVGLVVELFLRAWWIDSIISLAIVYFLVKEGLEAYKSENCNCD